jgi:TRAP-type C4-dicarboxylate transport system permease small subunit
MSKFSPVKHIEEVFCAVFLGIMVIIAFLNVVTRYVFKYSMAFTEELTLYLFVWITLLGVALAFKEGTNVSVSVLYNRFGKKVRKALYLLAVVCSLAFFAAFTYFGCLEVSDEISMNVTTEAMEFPVWIFTVSMPLAGVLTIIRIIGRTIDDMRSGNY